jgi:hypothetical protein
MVHSTAQHPIMADAMLEAVTRPESIAADMADSTPAVTTDPSRLT